MQIARRDWERNFYDWRYRFALLPTRIGRRVVWLEGYRWRHRKVEQKSFMYSAAFGMFNFDYEMQTRDGYSAILTVSGMYTSPFKTRTWRPASPDLKIVGEPRP
jgi:hypothetical protein